MRAARTANGTVCDPIMGKEFPYARLRKVFLM